MAWQPGCSNNRDSFTVKLEFLNAEFHIQYMYTHVYTLNEFNVFPDYNNPPLRLKTIKISKAIIMKINDIFIIHLLSFNGQTMLNCCIQLASLLYSFLISRDVRNYFLISFLKNFRLDFTAFGLDGAALWNGSDSTNWLHRIYVATLIIRKIVLTLRRLINKNWNSRSLQLMVINLQPINSNMEYMLIYVEKSFLGIQRSAEMEEKRGKVNKYSTHLFGVSVWFHCNSLQKTLLLQ